MDLLIHIFLMIPLLAHYTKRCWSGMYGLSLNVKSFTFNTRRSQSSLCCYYSRVYLDENFSDRWIGRWSIRLGSAFTRFICIGFLSLGIFQKPLATIMELQQSIEEACEQVTEVCINYTAWQINKRISYNIDLQLRVENVCKLFSDSWTEVCWFYICV